jgi:hypothetical protein
MRVNTNYAQGDEAELVKEVLGLSGSVLICWEHHAIISGIFPAKRSSLNPAVNSGDRLAIACSTSAMDCWMRRRYAGLHTRKILIVDGDGSVRVAM